MNFRPTNIEKGEGGEFPLFKLIGPIIMSQIVDLPVVEDEEQLDDLEDDKRHLGDAENEEQLGVVVNKNHLFRNDIESEVDQLSEYDDSSGCESAAEEECRGENEEEENHV